jgi:ribose 5-phosphate isomerase B
MVLQELNAVDQEMRMKIAIGTDHAGYELKEAIKRDLLQSGFDVEDFGVHSRDPADYPDIGADVARSVSEKKAERGILICTTGIGMSIIANKFSGVRAALCNSVETAKLSRNHNNANVLVLAGKTTPPDAAQAIVGTFLSSEFEAGGRHERRVNKIHQITGM